MSRKAVLILAIAVFGVVAAAASAATGHGVATIGTKRLAGPFCINKKTGVVRSVAVKTPCRKGEIRKLGVPVNGGLGLAGAQGPSGPAGPAGATGPAGPSGQTGSAGANGANGTDGAAGAQGPAGPQGAAGAQGPKGENGAPGADGKDGAVGPQGPAGPAGPQGPAGPAGQNGTNGLGNGTLTICIDGNGGINAAPCNGNQTPVEVVVVKNS